MNKLVLTVIAGLVTVLMCLAVLGVETSADDDEDTVQSNLPDPNAEDSTKFIGQVDVDGTTYKSFEEAVKAAKLSDSKKITFLTNSTFVTKISEKQFDCWCYNVENLRIDLGGKTISAGYLGLVLEGVGFKLYNGIIETQRNEEGESVTNYVLWIGNGDQETKDITLEGLSLDAGVNIFCATEVHIRGLSFSGLKYYAVWCDENANVSIEGGSFKTDGVAVIGGFDLDCSMQVKGGTFEVPEDKPLAAREGERNVIDPVITGGSHNGHPWDEPIVILPQS